MPLYFFHLSFGDRLMPDEEGVELPNRSAARQEALAVVRDLADPERGGNPRRWASWFLQVADEMGQFLRVPIGHPALEIVSEGQERHAEDPESKPIRPDVRRARASRSRSAEVVREVSAIKAHTAQLLQDNRQLRHDLSTLYLMSESLQIHARRLVACARVAASPADGKVYRTANKPGRRSPPRLVVLPGG